MKFLNNLFGNWTGNNSQYEDDSLESVKLFIINNLEQRWKMYVKDYKKPFNHRLVGKINAVQVLKFKGSPNERIKAEKIYNKNMSYGLVPSYRKEEIDIEITSFFDIYILFQTDNSVIFYAHIEDTNKQISKDLVSIRADLRNVKKEYESFIEDIHKKIYLSNVDWNKNLTDTRVDIPFKELKDNFLSIESQDWILEYEELRSMENNTDFYENSSNYFQGYFESKRFTSNSLSQMANYFIQIIDSAYLEFPITYNDDLLVIYKAGFIDMTRSIKHDEPKLVCSINNLLKKILVMSFYDVSHDHQDSIETDKEYYKLSQERMKDSL